MDMNHRIVMEIRETARCRIDLVISLSRGVPSTST